MVVAIAAATRVATDAISLSPGERDGNKGQTMSYSNDSCIRSACRLRPRSRRRASARAMRQIYGRGIPDFRLRTVSAEAWLSRPLLVK